MKGEFVELNISIDLSQSNRVERLETEIKKQTQAAKVLRCAITAVSEAAMTVEAVIVR